jgi:hypothetical protein
VNSVLINNNWLQMALINRHLLTTLKMELLQMALITLKMELHVCCTKWYPGYQINILHLATWQIIIWYPRVPFSASYIISGLHTGIIPE